MQKTGRPIQGAAHDRNGAGTARQEYRPLWGINLVWAIMRLPFRRWPGHSLRLPIGLALSRTEALAKTLKVPYRSRSALARRIVDHGATALPTRRIRVATDGGYATKVFLRALPSNVHVVGRLFLTAQRSQQPPEPVTGKRGAPRKKGPVIGAPKTLTTPSAAWQPHPQEAGAFIQAWVGIGHSVFPGRLLRVVVVWRPHLDGPATPNRSKAFGRLKPLEAFFSTAVSRSPHTMLETYEARWAIDIAIRDGHAYDGIAQDHGRKCEPIVGRGPVGKSCKRREFFPYLGFSPLWPKISQRLINQNPLRLKATKLMSRNVRTKSRRQSALAASDRARKAAGNPPRRQRRSHASRPTSSRANPPSSS